MPRDFSTMIQTPAYTGQENLTWSTSGILSILVPAALFATLEPTLSQARLARYGKKKGDTRETILARYLWNVALCEALYPTLNTFEVTFRNSVSQQLVRDYGPTWYQDPAFTGTLNKKGYEQLIKAQADLATRGKQITSDQVIAELNLGFWVALFVGSHHPYWHAKKRLITALPNLDPAKCQAPFLYPLIRDVHGLRNRVFHHERIFDDNDLSRKYRTARNITKWINPRVHEYLQCCDTFQQVYGNGIQPHLEKVKTLAAPPAQQPPS